jgi:hypothetical protein
MKQPRALFFQRCKLINESSNKQILFTIYIYGVVKWLLMGVANKYLDHRLK